MRKILKNKVYDTETAKLCGEYSNGYSYSDFNHMREELYLKKTGEFFIYGTGGALSKYSQSYGDSMGYGEKITPVSYEKAQEWAEDHLEAKDYEAIFGEVSEDDEGEVGMHVAIPKVLYDKISQERLQKGKQMKDIVIQALEDYFSK